MRFPWLQVDSDFREAKAGDLGALLDISRREAVGLMVDLWAWVLTRSPDDRPPDGIISGTGAVAMLERAAEWTGERGRLVAALEELALLERLPDGIRLRGVGRYAATWKKNRGGKGFGTGAAEEPERNRPGSLPRPEHKTQTQTQTQTQRKKKEDPPDPTGGGESREVWREVQPAPAASWAEAPTANALPFEAEQPAAEGWTLPDAVDAVHREVMEGRAYRWDTVHDEKAATVLLSLCVADGVPVHLVPEEVGRRFGRALVRSLWRFERAAGKAVTLRELARRECWSINAEPPRQEREVRGDLSGVVGRQEVAVEPWDAMLAKREAA